jgi:hypothetical protein
VSQQPPHPEDPQYPPPSQPRPDVHEQPSAAEQMLTEPLDRGDLGAELKSARGGVTRTTMVLGAVVLAAVAFGGGMFVEKAVASPTAAVSGQGAGRGQFGQGQGQGQFGQGGQGARGAQRGTTGTVDHVDGNTVYVKAQDGSTVKVTTSNSTAVDVTKQGSLADLAPGAQVVVQGNRGSDGTVAAQRITARPANNG